MSIVKCTCKIPPMPDGCVYHGIASTPPAPVTASEGRQYQYRLVSMPEVAEMGYLPNAEVSDGV